VCWELPGLSAFGVHDLHSGVFPNDWGTVAVTRPCPGTESPIERLGRLQAYGAERLAGPDPELLVTYRSDLDGSMSRMHAVKLVFAIGWTAFWIYWLVAAFSMKRGQPAGEVINFSCHGATVWPVYVASLVKPDLGIMLKRD
jgi:hypothetical protein